MAISYPPRVHSGFCPDCSQQPCWPTCLSPSFAIKIKVRLQERRKKWQSGARRGGKRFLFASVCFTPAWQAWAGSCGGPERGHSPHTHTQSSLETRCSPTRPGTKVPARPQRRLVLGGSALTQLATASGPAGTLLAGSCLGRISSFHFIGNYPPDMVCPVTQWLTCVLCSWVLSGLTSGSLAPSTSAGASEDLPAASSPSPWGHRSCHWLQPGDAHQAFRLLPWPDTYLFIYAGILDMGHSVMVLPPLGCGTLHHCGGYL